METTEPVEVVPEAEPTEPGVRRPLRRSASDRMIAGVAGGLATYLGVSSLAVRTVFGIAAVVIAYQIWTLLGVALVTSLLMWIFVPRDDVGVSPAGRIKQRFPRIGPTIGLVVLLAGAAALAVLLGIEPWLLWPVLLIGGGVLLYRRDAGLSSLTPAVERATVPPGTEPPARSTPAPEPRAPRPPRERSPLGWFGLGVALLVVGGAAVLQNLGAIELRLVAFPAIALVILGVTMLVGTLFGRARWLTLPALLVVPFLLVASMITVPLEGGVGDLYEFPRSASEVQAEYRRVVGGINLQLNSLDGADTSVTIESSTGVGEISILVPFDAHVIATGRAGLGIVHIGRLQTERVVDATLSTTWEPRFGDGPTIVLDLETGIGDIWVTRLAPTRKELRELRVER